MDDERICDCPHGPLEQLRCERYDACYCTTCHAWLEDTCTDRDCKFCAHRPPRHVDEGVCASRVKGS